MYRLLSPATSMLLGLVLVAALVLPLAPVTGNGQVICDAESLQIPWIVAPGIAAIEGSLETNTPTRVVIGDRSGEIQLWDLSLGSLSFSQGLTAGNGLPANVKGIWDVAALDDEGTFLALVTYTHADGEYYGFMRSTDLGLTWSLIEPASLRDEQFKSVDATNPGSYWRSPLYEMEWLDDGMHGWAWGVQGIVATTDGGATWSINYRAMATGNVGGGNYQPVWGLAMESPTKGVAAIGPIVGSGLRFTSDGGVTFPSTVKNLGQFRACDVEVINGQYRVITFDPQIRRHLNNSFFHYGKHGVNWNNNPRLKDIETDSISWSTPSTNAIWTTPTIGFLVQHQGEIWRTDDGGADWRLIQLTDPGYDTVYYGDGFPVDGNGRPPFHPRTGYGQRTIATHDDFGDPFLVHAISDSCYGRVRGYVPVWDVGSLLTSVPTEDPALLGISVIPNPTAATCRLTFHLESPSNVDLRLVTGDGRVVSEESLGRRDLGEHTERLSLDGLPSGVYRVLITTDGGRTSMPVVVGR